MTKFVRTVLGDVSPDRLGVTYVHEHLIIDSPLVRETMPHIHLPSAEDAADELGLCRDAGVGTVVDTMPAGSGRSVERLVEASRRSGVHIVASTGMHTQKYYDDVAWANTEDAEHLASRFIADLQIGIDRHDYLGSSVHRTEHRAGIIKAATSAEPNPQRDRRVFEAAAIASRRTGAPMLTHCEAGLGAAHQIELLESLEVPLERVVISHTDKVDDPIYHRDLLETGVHLEYDQALRQSDTDDNTTAMLLRSMIDRGFLAQLMVGTDGARRTLWSSLGGRPGLSWLASGFRSTMRRHGIGDAHQHVLFVENPRRFLAFTPPEESLVV
jgi:phosphotriesterase-related protein